VGGDLGNMTNGDPHNLERYHKKTFSKLKNSENISEHNKNVLEHFHNYLLSQDLSDSRITRHLQCLKTLAEYIDHDIESMSKTQMRELVAAINQDRIKDQELADSTKAEYRKSLIKFYSDFLQSPGFDGNELTDFFTSTTRLKRPDPDKLPTPDTVRKLMANVEKGINRLPKPVNKLCDCVKEPKLDNELFEEFGIKALADLLEGCLDVYDLEEVELAIRPELLYVNKKHSGITGQYIPEDGVKEEFLYEDGVIDHPYELRCGQCEGFFEVAEKDEMDIICECECREISLPHAHWTQYLFSSS